MRYEYTVTKDSGEVELMKAMSWKKLLKSVLLKYPKFSGWCTYINKHGHHQVKNFTNGKIVHERKRNQTSDQGSSGSVQNGSKEETSVCPLWMYTEA